MKLAIGTGFLMTDPSSPSDNIVFVQNDVVYQPDDMLTNGTATSSTTRAADWVADAYAEDIDAGRHFTTFEYNRIARFTGMPSANLCSGE